MVKQWSIMLTQHCWDSGDDWDITWRAGHDHKGGQEACFSLLGHTHILSVSIFKRFKPVVTRKHLKTAKPSYNMTTAIQLS